MPVPPWPWDAFATRFAGTRTEYGPLVWGRDPSVSVLDSWGIGETPDGLDRFADIALSAAIGTVGLVKLQAAFHERHGGEVFTRAFLDVLNSREMTS